MASYSPILRASNAPNQGHHTIHSYANVSTTSRCSCDIKPLSNLLNIFSQTNVHSEEMTGPTSRYYRKLRQIILLFIMILILPLLIHSMRSHMTSLLAYVGPGTEIVNRGLVSRAYGVGHEPYRRDKAQGYNASINNTTRKLSRRPPASSFLVH